MQIAELSGWLYEDLNGQIISVAARNQGLLVTLECDDMELQNTRRRFMLNCRETRESTVTVGSVGWVEWLDEHLLLLKHNSEHSELMFSSAPEEPFAVIGRLSEAHNKFFGHWRNLSEHLNASASILSGGHGMIARGPTSTMELYAAAIGDLLRVNIVKSYTPKSKYRVLILDTQFVVCSEVDVMEI